MGSCVTIQTLYRGWAVGMTVFCVAIHQVYRDRSEGLAWRKAVSRYKFCIVIEVA